jgi:hypothetical protein
MEGLFSNPLAFLVAKEIPMHTWWSAHGPKTLRLAKCCNLNASESIDSLWDELEALLTLCNRKDFRFSLCI